MTTFDPETLERWRRAGARVAHREIRDALYRRGSSSSEDFLDAFEEAVGQGILTWAEIEALETE